MQSPGGDAAAAHGVVKRVEHDQLGKIGWTVFYHDFSADTGGADYGDEIDLQLLYKSRWKQVFGLKGALYSAENHAADTDKWMLWTAYKI